MTAFTVSLVLSGSAVLAGSFENDLRARWRGAWVVVETEAYSSCASGYSENRIHEMLVHGSGERFKAGELARVEAVQVRKKSVELRVSFTAMHLLPYQDGPFDLYSPRHCRVQLQVGVSKETIKGKDVDGVDAVLLGVVERHATEDGARASQSWNRRADDEYPADYPLTLARHAAWQAEQLNLTVTAKKELALDEAGKVTARIRSDPPYLEGFASGAMRMRQWKTIECGELIAKPFPKVRHSVPEEHEGDGHESWREGFEDGQLIVYSVLMIERLPTCYVEVPEVPAES